MDIKYEGPGPDKKNTGKTDQDRERLMQGQMTRDRVEAAIKGVFSTQNVVKVGTGSTTRKTIQKTYWHVKELDNGDVEVQPLNPNYVPSGPKKVTPREDFLTKYSPEPEFYVSTVFPKMKEMQETIVRGEKHRARGELYSAEFEFDTALKVDEENVRANFGLGLTYLDRGETTKANDIFERLVKLDAAFEKEHKHLFNDFGINLRKNRMFDQAVEYYGRALELTEQDENLYMNIARAFFEKGDTKSCIEHLAKCIQLNPSMEEARLFWDYLTRQGLTDKPYPGTAKAPDAKSAPAKAAAKPAAKPASQNGEAKNGDDKDSSGDARPKPSGKPIKLDI